MGIVLLSSRFLTAQHAHLQDRPGHSTSYQTVISSMEYMAIINLDHGYKRVRECQVPMDVCRVAVKS